MDLADYAKKIAAFGLPLLGAALPVPGGAALGAALASAISSPTAAPADILATLTASADAVARAKQFELEHAEHMLKITTDAEVTEYQTDAADRNSARDLQKSTRSWIVPALAIIVTFGFFGILIAMMTHYMNAHDSPELLLLLGSLATAWGAIVNFYFGSSASSQNKDATIQKMAGG